MKTTIESNSRELSFDQTAEKVSSKASRINNGYEESTGKKEEATGISREKSNVSLSKLSSKDGMGESIPGSQQRARLSDVLSSNLPLSREDQSIARTNTADVTLPPNDSALDQSISPEKVKSLNAIFF